MGYLTDSFNADYPEMKKKFQAIKISENKEVKKNAID
jgi:hypothetical protein